MAAQPSGSSYLLAATAGATNDRVYFFSFSFFIKTEIRKMFRTAMFCVNLIILLFGVVEIYLSVCSQQDFTVFKPLIFLVLALLNINALKKMYISNLQNDRYSSA